MIKNGCKVIGVEHFQSGACRLTIQVSDGKPSNGGICCRLAWLGKGSYPTLNDALALLNKPCVIYVGKDDYTEVTFSDDVFAKGGD